MSHTFAARNRLNALQRYRAPDDPEVLDARRDLVAANVEQAAQRVADALPPLTPQQRARVGALLMPALAGLNAEANDAAS